MEGQIPAIILAVGLNGLGAVRSLGAHRVPVYVICNSADQTILRSRYVLGSFIVKDGEDFEERVLEVLLNNFSGGGVILPTSDQTVELVQNKKNHLDSLGFKFLIPPENTVTILNDKKSELEFMEGLDVPCPKSETSISDFDSLKKLSFPVIIKPRRFDGYSLIGAKNIILKNDSDLKDFYRKHKDIFDELIAQEIIEGPDENLWVCNCLFDQRSQLVSCFTFNRLGTSPSHYGVTTSAIGYDNKKIKNLVASIGKKIGYVGPAMFEFKKDSRDDEYKYIEINPRIGMCNWFDTQSRVNNVYNYYCLMSGKEHLMSALNQRQLERGYIDFFSDLYARVEDGQSIFFILKIVFRVLLKRPVFAVFYIPDFFSSLIGVRGGLAFGFMRLKKKLKRILLSN